VNTYLSKKKCECPSNSNFLGSNNATYSVFMSISSTQGWHKLLEKEWHIGLSKE
jgi:hypothetical protein